MIHAPDDIDSTIAHLASRLEFFNSLSHKRSSKAHSAIDLSNSL